jgi:hypothetical protein
MKANVIMCAFTEPTREIKDVEFEATVIEDVLGEAFTRFNHAVPGETGDLAEKHETCSMSVGDVVAIFDQGDTRIFLCESFGWTEITEKGLEAWLELPRRDRIDGISWAKHLGVEIETV